MRIAISLFGIAFALFVLELPAALHLIHYRDLFKTADPVPWEHPSNRLDPTLFHVRKPNIELQGTQNGGDISFYYEVENPNAYPYNAKYDADGFRNDNNLKDASIVVIGDSFVESLLTSREDHFVTLLEKETGRTVRNLGQLWYGPQQELEVLRRYALPNKPQTIIWMFFEGNDLSDYLRYEKQEKIWHWQQENLRGFFERSFTKNILLRVRSLFSQKAEREVANSSLCSSSKEVSVALYFYYNEIEQSREILDALSETKGIIKEAYLKSLSTGSRFIFTFLPSKARVYKSLCTPKGDTRMNEWLAKELRRYVEEELSEAYYVDLTEPLLTASKESGLTYFTDDTHWTPLGHKVVANTLAKSLK